MAWSFSQAFTEHPMERKHVQNACSKVNTRPGMPFPGRIQATLKLRNLVH